MNAHRIWSVIRRLAPLSVPLALGGIEVFHPTPNTVEELLPDAGWFLTLHVLQLPLFGLLALVMWDLMAGLSGRWAAVSRWSLWPFMVFYAAFDAVAGMGGGIVARHAAHLHGDHRAIGVDLVERINFDWTVMLIAIIGGLAWCLSATAGAIALRRSGAAWLPVGSLILAGLIFGFSHVPPFGPVAMACFFISLLALDRRRQRLTAPAALAAGGIGMSGNASTALPSPGTYGG